MKAKDLILEIHEKMNSLDDIESEEFLLRLSVMSISMIRELHGNEYADRLLRSYKSDSYDKDTPFKKITDTISK